MKPARWVILAIALAVMAQSARADWWPAKRITWTSGWSDYPSIDDRFLVDIHVVWLDDTPGN